jgi:hypothetical protein
LINKQSKSIFSMTGFSSFHTTLISENFLRGLQSLRRGTNCVLCWQLRQNGSLFCLKWCKNGSNIASVWDV